MPCGFFLRFSSKNAILFRMENVDKKGREISVAHSLAQFQNDLRALGVQQGDTLLMHSSFKSLGGIEGGAQGLFCALMEVLGQDGTLILPALSYATVNAEQPIFDRANTPSCIGFLPEFFRTQVPGVVRSLHATHSCCALGKRAYEMTCDHELDDTPVGPHSPFAKLPHVNGKILILGSHPDHNTSLHGVEETAVPPYLFREERVHYVLRDGEKEIHQQALRHNFYVDGVHWDQRYARIIDLLSEKEVKKGKVLSADCVLMDAKAVWEKGHAKLMEDPWYFVEKPQGVHTNEMLVILNQFDK